MARGSTQRNPNPCRFLSCAIASQIALALNGDIDNYLDLRRRYEEETGRKISDRITTDAKVIALWVDHHHFNQVDDWELNLRMQLKSMLDLEVFYIQMNYRITEFLKTKLGK